MSGYPPAKGLVYPIEEVRVFFLVRLAISKGLNESYKSFLNNRWRQAIEVGLKGIVNVRIECVNPCIPLVFC